MKRRTEGENPTDTEEPENNEPDETMAAPRAASQRAVEEVERHAEDNRERLTFLEGEVEALRERVEELEELTTTQQEVIAELDLLVIGAYRHVDALNSDMPHRVEENREESAEQEAALPGPEAFGGESDGD